MSQVARLVPSHPHANKVVISPSRLTGMTVGCSWREQFHLLRIKSHQSSRSITLGSLIDVGIESVIHGDDLHTSLVLVEIRAQRQFALSVTPEDLGYAKMAVRLFHEWWTQQDLIAPISLPNGFPAVQVRLAMPHPHDAGIELKAFLDFIGTYLPTGELIVIDFKTGKSRHKPGFGLRAEQLTFAQLLVDHHMADLGLADYGQTDKIGYLEIHTSAKQPVLGELKTYARRTPAQLDELLKKSEVVAGRIRRGEFFRDPGMAFNSPCNLCEYETLCRAGARAIDEYDIPAGVAIPRGLEE